MSIFLERSEIEAAYLEACRLDVESLKPGNVHVDAPGHRMEASQFVASARVTAPIISDPKLSVGARVLRSVEATLAVAGCNTNLGILLLTAPLAAAAGRDLASFGMRERLSSVLSALDHHDASDVYAAIARAGPAGLGEVEAGMDVRTVPPPGLSLRAAMQAAAGRDLIAHEYVTDFERVFSLWRDALRPWLAAGWSKEAALARLFLAELASRPDTHIARKHGLEAAERVRGRAEALQGEVQHAATPEAWAAPEVQTRLAALDSDLKAAGLNPGSLADLMVATAFLSEIGERGRAPR